MKKTLCALLCLALIMSLGCFALGDYTEYDLNILSQLGMTVDQLTQSDMRAQTAAAIILDYILADYESGLRLIENCSLGNARLCPFATYTMDLYIPMSDGKYWNLFVNLSNGRMMDFGKGSYNGTEEKVYYNVDMLEVLNELSGYLELFGEEN